MRLSALLLAACAVEGTGATYPAADLVRFDVSALGSDTVDPRAGKEVVEVETEAGHDWSVVITDGQVLVGIPALGEVRAYEMDGTDPAEGAGFLEGEVAEAYGAALSAAGGVLLVGAPLADAGPDSAASGTVERRGDSVREVSGQATQGHFGAGVAACGDVNNDGVADAAISAPWEAELSGRVYLLGGAGNATTTATLASVAGAPSSGFGASLACDHDIFGDPAADLAIGAPWAAAVTLWDRDAVDAGAPAVTLTQSDAPAFGAAVAECHFHDGDRADLVVGAPGGEGSAYVWFGGDTLGATPDVTLLGEAAAARFGSTLGCGDVDGDGLDELFVGAPGENAADGTVETGALYGFDGLGLTTGVVASSDAAWRFAADRAFLRTGERFALGDLDDDGVAELVLVVRQRARGSTE